MPAPAQCRTGKSRIVRRKGDPGQKRADGIERADIRVGEERAASRDLGNPDGKPAAGVGVVNGLLQRIVIDERVPAAEVAARKERIGIDRNDEKQKEPGQPEGFRALARREDLRAQTVAVVCTVGLG